VNLQGDKSLQQAVEAYRVLRCWGSHSA
jgi:hypothetical protein